MVSVVIVTQNRCGDLQECLNSVMKQSRAADEVIVIDNASNDNTPEMIRKKYPSVKLIRMPFNTGCPGGRNIGILNASGDIILFLDDDCVVDCDALQKIMKRFSEEPELGVISMAVVNYDSGNKEQPFFSPSNLGSEERYFYSFSGGASAVKKEVFDRVGLFPEEYMYGGEERDISYRIMSEGYRILYFPTVKMYHKRSPLMRHTYNRYRSCIFNEITIFLKYYPYRRSILAILWKLFYFFLYSIKKHSLLHYFIIMAQLPLHILRKISSERHPLDERIFRIEQLLKNQIVKDAADLENI